MSKTITNEIEKDFCNYLESNNFSLASILEKIEETGFDQEYNVEIEENNFSQNYDVVMGDLVCIIVNHLPYARYFSLFSVINLSELCRLKSNLYLYGFDYYNPLIDMYIQFLESQDMLLDDIDDNEEIDINKDAEKCTITNNGINGIQVYFYASFKTNNKRDKCFADLKVKSIVFAEIDYELNKQNYYGPILARIDNGIMNIHSFKDEVLERFYHSFSINSIERMTAGLRIAVIPHFSSDRDTKCDITLENEHESILMIYATQKGLIKSHDSEQFKKDAVLELHEGWNFIKKSTGENRSLDYLLSNNYRWIIRHIKKGTIDSWKWEKERDEDIKKLIKAAEQGNREAIFMLEGLKRYPDILAGVLDEKD